MPVTIVMFEGQVKESINDFIKKVDSGEMSTGKRGVIGFSIEDMQRETVGKKLSDVIRIIELFRTLKFTSYWSVTQVIKSCSLGRTFMDCETVEDLSFHNIKHREDTIFARKCPQCYKHMPVLCLQKYFIH